MFNSLALPAHTALNEKLLTEFVMGSLMPPVLKTSAMYCTMYKPVKCCTEDVKAINTLNSPVNKVTLF